MEIQQLSGRVGGVMLRLPQKNEQHGMLVRYGSASGEAKDMVKWRDVFADKIDRIKDEYGGTGCTEERMA
jgi:hypothetical protein